MKTVPELLREAADTFEERSKLYGDNYKKFGHMMDALFPNGLTVKGPDAFNRLGIFIQVASKFTREAEQFDNTAHDDSLLDMSVYANMLRELKAGERERSAEVDLSDFTRLVEEPKEGWKLDWYAHDGQGRPDFLLEWDWVEYEVRSGAIGRSTARNLSWRWSKAAQSPHDIVRFRKDNK